MSHFYDHIQPVRWTVGIDPWWCVSYPSLKLIDVQLHLCYYRLPLKGGNHSTFPPAQGKFLLFNHCGAYWHDVYGCRVQFSVFVMHRRTDLWGPDGTFRLTTCPHDPFESDSNICSTRVRPGPIYRWKITRISCPQSIHIFTLRHGTEVMLGPTSAYFFNDHDSGIGWFTTIWFTYNFLVCIPRNILLPYPSSAKVFSVQICWRCTAREFTPTCRVVKM